MTEINLGFWSKLEEWSTTQVGVKVGHGWGEISGDSLRIPHDEVYTY